MIYTVLLLSLILRLVLANQSFWLDEGAALVIARQNIPQLLSSLKGDFHPPLFYLILHFWEQLGNKSEIFLRLPNIVFGVMTVGVLYLLVKKIHTPILALVSALLLAFNPLHIYYSQELRMYSLSCLLTVTSWYLLKKKNFWLFTLITTANLYTFYGAIFNLVAQSVYTAFYDRKNLTFLGKSVAISSLLFVPWLPTFFEQLKGGQFLQTVLPGWGTLSGKLTIKSLALIATKFSLGRINLAQGNLYLLTAISVCLYFGSLVLLSLKQKVSHIWLLWLVVPIAVATILSIKTPMLGYWRFIGLIPAFSVLLALGIDQLPKKLAWTNLGVVILTLLMANVVFWTHVEFQREDWRTATNWVNQQDNTTTSLFAFSDAFAPVRWYAPNLNYKAVLPNLAVETDSLDQTMNQATADKKTIMYFEYLSPLTDPTHSIRTWLDNAGFKMEEIKNFNGVGFVYVYKTQ